MPKAQPTLFDTVEPDGWPPDSTVRFFAGMLRQHAAGEKKATDRQRRTLEEIARQALGDARRALGPS